MANIITEPLPPIEIRKHFRCTTEKLWETIVNPKGWTPWFTQDMSVEIKEGGNIFIKWISEELEEEVSDSGKIISFTPYKKIEFIWNFDGREFRSDVIMEIYESSFKGSWLYIKDTFKIYGRNDIELYNMCSTGWGEFLTKAKFFIEKETFIKS